MEKKIGLVLEGGGYRGVFTEGVLECLIEEQIQIPYVIGVSMGSINGANYIAKQKRRNYDITMTYLDDPRYVGMKNMLTQGSLFGMDFLFKDIAYDLNPFDFETFYKADQELVIGAMSCHSGLTNYFYKKDLDEKPLLKAIQASCSLPFISRKVSIKGIQYLDGGISDAIPVKKALADGCEKVIVILTRDEQFVRKPFTQSRLGNIMYREQPAVVRLMESRHIRYSETLAYLKELEEAGVAMVIRPPKPIDLDRAEKNREKIRDTYLMGYHFGKDNMEKIKSFVGDMVPINQ